jgi:hypothetical protein
MTAAKSAIHGLVAMGSLNFTDVAGSIPDNGMEEINAHPGVYKAADVNLTWAQLEPAQGVFDDSALQNALATIAAYNARFPTTPVTAKLRIYTGPNVPAWIFALTGGPITVANSSGSMQIAAFWSSAYITAWRALQAHLAGEYDASSAIAEVAVSSCASLTAEPFVAPLDAVSLTAMEPAGFSDTSYQACLRGAPADYAAWVKTPLDYTFNGYRDFSSGTLIADPAFTISVMQAWRTSLGSRAVVANHGLQPVIASGAQPVYAELQTLGPPMEFQTISPTVDWDASIATAMTYHPSEIEIWPTTAAGGSANVSLTQLQTYAAELAAE